MFPFLHPVIRGCLFAAIVALTLGLYPRADASVDPLVSPNALPEATNLIQLLDTIKGTYILSGQQETVDWFGSDNAAEFPYLIGKTGREPVVRGYDYLFVSDPRNTSQRIAERAIQWSRRGGVVTICFHWFMETSSPNGSAFYTQSANATQYTNYDIRQAVIDGTPENLEFVRELDLVANDLKKLRDARVPVLWRPFHEVSGTWFWWSTKGAEPFKAAWRFMFDRLTRVHGLNNLIWVYNPNDPAGVLEEWYPGDDTVDMITLDVYPATGTHPTYAANYKRYRDFKSSRKIVGLSENGAIPDPDNLFLDGAHWAYFCTWSGSFVTGDSVNPNSFLNRVYNHANVITLDEMPVLRSQLVFPLQPLSQAVAAGSTATFTAQAAGAAPITYQWQLNGVDIPGATTASLTVANVQVASSGAYSVVANNNVAGSVNSDSAMLTLSTTAKVTGAAYEFASNIQHPNGNVYDQILLTGAAATVTADANQVTRLSYLDLSGDVVQVEFSGAGTLTITLENASGPAVAAKYNQPAVQYMTGHATITLAGVNQNSHVSIFTVGSLTAVNQSLFKPGETYDGVADIALLNIAGTTGRLGSIRGANTEFSSTRGWVGINARHVRIGGPVNLHNIAAADQAKPLLLTFTIDAGQIGITGGDLFQPNGRPIEFATTTKLVMSAGTSSHNVAQPAQSNRGQLRLNDYDITAQAIQNP